MLTHFASPHYGEYLVLNNDNVLPNFENLLAMEQFMLRTFIDTIEYYDRELTVKLKPIFESLRQLKNHNIIEINGLKGRTLKTLIVL